MRNPIWYPYTQMKLMSPPLEVVSAEGVRLRLADGRRLIDAVSSWWCVIHGYNHPELNRAAAEQLARMAHVMLGGLTHAPARRLAEKLIEITPAGLEHVFYGDSGSVGVEIALKMALQFWRNQGRREKTSFLALKKAYHGDTLGCMSVCDPDDGMHALFAGLVPRQRFVGAPRGGFEAPPEAVEADIKTLESVLVEHHAEIAGFIVEPLLQAAGGFNIYSPLYLQKARELCDRYGVLLLYDEVATGFGRTGALFASDRAGAAPDIMVLGKGLTAGYTGHSATLASNRVFEAFYGDDRGQALMHGPTFMGNPLACAVGLKSIEIFERENYLERIARIEKILKERLPRIESPRIRDVRVLGACGVLEVRGREDYEGLQAFAADRGVWLRPFDNFVYTMPPYVITDEELLSVVGVMEEWFARP